ncbi:MAG: DNA ligase-associated DEXH box helicase [Nitrosomonas sp.]|nr:MAG: DNA ligase-associated DEXH box helicase [Nitrosomonas sp.]
MSRNNNERSLVKMTEQGLYCEPGNFYIDPHSGPVENAVITHAHSDHARNVANKFFATKSSAPILYKRLGSHIDLNTHHYREIFYLKDTKVSFHSAGHILGSAQVRIECNNEVWLVTGDFKRDQDPSCEPYEVVMCDTLISEATFALPVYRWAPSSDIAKDILAWWENNISSQQTSILFCYALGKAQRVLAELDKISSRKVLLHGAISPLVEIYRDAGIAMPRTEQLNLSIKRDYRGELILAPPSAAGSAWMRRFKDVQTGFCSGWMRVRGNRRRKGYDRGFVLSDHADWPSLLQTISECGAKQVLLHHGFSHILVRYLNEQSINARSLESV